MAGWLAAKALAPPQRASIAAVMSTGSRTRLRYSTSTSRSEEHTSELQSLMRISYAVFCLNKKKMQNKDYRLTKAHTLPLDTFYRTSIDVHMRKMNNTLQSAK